MAFQSIGTAPQEPAIVAQNLNRVFRRPNRGIGVWAKVKSFINPEWIEKTAVEDVSFSLPKGARVGIVGANGAGKTTLLKMIAGLLQPTQGSIQCFGYEPSQRERAYLKRIGMVMGQKSQLWVDIPARETFDLLAAIYDLPSDEYQSRLQHLSELFEIKHLLSTQVRRLSLGERMKMEILASLLHKPDLLILDEPTIGLDIVARRGIRLFLKEYCQSSQTTLLISSHDMTDISEVCEDLLFVSHGRLYFSGPLKDFQKKLGSQMDRRKVVLEFESPDHQSLCLERLNTKQSRAESWKSTSPSSLECEVLPQHVGSLLADLCAVATPVDIRMEGLDLESLVHQVMEENR